MKNRIKKIFSVHSIEWINNKYLLYCVWLSLFLNIVMEAVSRHSLIKAVVYLFTRPVMFVFNAAIIYLFLVVGLIFRRRLLYSSVIGVLMLALGITNGVLLCFRTTPFAAVDFLLITTALRIVKLYLSPVIIVLILVAIVAVIIVCIILGLKVPKYQGRMHIFAWIIMAGLYGLTLVGMNRVLVGVGVATENFSNLADAYHNYGLPYCFANSVINFGMKEPDDYSTEVVDAIVEEALKESLPVDPNVTTGPVKEQGASAEPETEAEEENLPEENQSELEHPNIIFLQLESFFDPEKVYGLELSEDPIPYFRSLLKQYSSGYLNVPSVGAGTANTEFEVLTGMDLDYFGPGEYPYKTILKSTTCESVAYNLSALGYATHAIHNNDGTFYDRHIVFSQLGFDTFTPIEYMYDVERNVNGFCNDDILVDEITDTLNSTKQEDLCYTITVQAHGEYPSERLTDEEPIFIRYTDQSREYAWSYYVNQIAQTDAFIKSLTEALEERGEPTILVMYGDHLPYMNLESEDISNGVLTQTQYVIWDNMGLKKEDRDMESYQLSARVLEQANISQGIITQIHQNCMQDEDYLDKLEVVQYDMLYGNLEIYGGVNPYPASDLRMGIHKITVGNVVEKEDAIYLYGNNFNEFSVVYLNGHPLKTTYVEKNLILAEKTELADGDQITVAQVGTDGYVLGETDSYSYSVLAQE